MADLFRHTYAHFSDCGMYRYLLGRVWNPDAPLMIVCMLNPSTANDVENDPTIERCERRARMDKYGGLLVVNLFALRSTDPRALYLADDPVGPENDRYIADAFDLIGDKGLFLCGWGKHASKVCPARADAVLSAARQAGVVPHVLGLNGDGSPKHPLYISYDVRPAPLDRMEVA